MTKTIAFNEIVWSAIAEPSRRMLLDLLVEKALSASMLAEEVSFSRQAVAKHMIVLKNAGLVKSKRHGKEVLFEIKPLGLHAAANELAQAAKAWDARLIRIKQLAEELHNRPKKN